MDYVTANPEQMDSLLQLHSDLIVRSVLDTVKRYPCLAGQTVRVYIERNTSHAHAAFIAKSLESQFQNTNINLAVEREFSRDGREKIGIWTKNKSNLVHVAQLLLDTNLVSIAEDVVCVCNQALSDESVVEGACRPSFDDIKEVLRSQLTDFRRIVQVDGKQNLTGKVNNGNDDLAMAFILWLAWSCYLITNLTEPSL
jgi:hypothetical protein